MSESNTSFMPFLRKARITVTTPTGAQTEIVADGTRTTPRVSFSIRKSLLNYSPNITEVNIWNLSREHRNLFRTRFSQIKIELGWENNSYKTVFIGNILNASSNREGAEIVTKIYAMTSIVARTNSFVSLSFKTGTPLDIVVKGIAAEFNAKVPSDQFKVAISDTKIKLDKVMEQACSFCGMAQDALHKLGDRYGFTWSIQDNVFQALDDKFAGFPSATVLSVENGTLMSLTPILNSQMQVESGVNIVAFLVPTFNPGDIVTVQSTINPQLNGKYKVHLVDMVGDTCSPEWKMTLQSFVSSPTITSNSRP